VARRRRGREREAGERARRRSILRFRFRRSRFSKIGLSRDLDNEIGCQRLPEETNVGAVKHSALPMLHLRPDTAGPKWDSPDTPWLKLPNTCVDLPEGVLPTHADGGGCVLVQQRTANPLSPGFLIE
jgi:hypothetical protein